jgi:hypothetical protein
MKHFTITSFIAKLRRLAERFPVTLLLVAGLFGLALWTINAPKANISYQWWVFLITAPFLSLATALGVENVCRRRWQYAITLAPVALWGIHCSFLPPEHWLRLDDCLLTGACGVVFLLAVFFISFLKGDRDAAFWTFSKAIVFQAFTACLFGGILSAGLSLAVFSLDGLFGTGVKDEVFANILAVCMLVFSPVYFLANIPGRAAKYSNEMSFHKTLKILGLYILTPILAIYTVILYAYLAKIVAAWELPNGWVSVLVSILAGGGLLVILILYPVYVKKENKVAVFLSRRFGLLLLPLLALMTVGIFRRIGDYGLTINRCYVLLLNVWFYAIFIYLFITRSRHIRWIPVSVAVLLLLSSAGPWRFSRITRIALQSRLEASLSSLDFLKNGKISLSESPAFFKNIDPEEKEKIFETLEYLADTYGEETVQPYFEDDITDKSGYGLIRELDLTPPESYAQGFSVDITGVYFRHTADYRYFLSVAFNRREDSGSVSIQNDRLLIETGADNRTFSIPLKETTINMAKAAESQTTYTFSLPFSPENKGLAIRGQQYLFLIARLRGEIYPEQNDSIQINSLQGYLFYK